jgi:tetratricopeptide (TPR) repeat protein
MTIEPDNSRHRRNAADILAMRLPVQANLGDKAGVMKDYKTTIEIFEKISTEDPKNFEARFDIAFTQDYMCRSLVKLGSVQEAQQYCRKAVETGESLLEIDPTNAEAHKFVFETYSFFFDSLYKARDYGNAFKNLHRLLEIMDKWSAKETAGYIYKITNRIGNIYFEVASNPKTAPATKKENWQSARRWFHRTLQALYDLQKLEGVNKKDQKRILEIKQKIGQCDAALQKRPA